MCCGVVLVSVLSGLVVIILVRLCVSVLMCCVFFV